MSARVLVTGASGFVGRALCGALIGRCQVRGAVRRPGEGCSLDGTEVILGSLSADFDWTDALFGVSEVVHCAARVHVMNEESSDPLAEYRMFQFRGDHYRYIEVCPRAELSGYRTYCG